MPELFWSMTEIYLCFVGKFSISVFLPFSFRHLVEEVEVKKSHNMVWLFFYMLNFHVFLWLLVWSRNYGGHETFYKFEFIMYITWFHVLNPFLQNLAFGHFVDFFRQSLTFVPFCWLLVINTLFLIIFLIHSIFLCLNYKFRVFDQIWLFFVDFWFKFTFVDLFHESWHVIFKHFFTPFLMEDHLESMFWFYVCFFWFLDFFGLVDFLSWLWLVCISQFHHSRFNP